MAARHGVFLLLLVIVIQTVASRGMLMFLLSASQRNVICEDSKTTLSCPWNQVIKITQATYGRSDKRTCKHPNMKSTRCVTKKPLGISRKNCNGRTSCTVAANNRLYGDPCPGTYKYVTVTYSCKVKKTPKCLRRCHKQAKCIRGKCVCKSGYKGDGIRSCTNIKESAYIGCYQDHRKRILPKDVLTDKSMTVQKCRQFCRKKGFKFAGVENGNECFCGDVLRKNKQRKEGDCKTPCSGNKQQICGGPWRISIYTGTGSFPSHPSAGPNVIRKRSVEKENAFVKAITKATELNLNQHILVVIRITEKEYCKDVTDKSMTVQKCRQFCRKKGFKYAGVEVASKRKVICEDSKTTLSCPSNQVIKITQATYGRSNKRTCKHPNMKTTRCVTKRPLGISRKNCNGRKSCTVAANNRLYGDPCPGTYKYVTVTYSCKVKKTPKCLRICHRQAKCIRGKCVCKSGYKGDGIRSCTNIKAGKRKVICEDSKTTLSCPSNQVIKITQATYGRSNKRTCKHPNMKTTRCVTKKPLGISRKNCNGRKSCTVAANNRLYGDPCPGTYKYVTVTYSCKVKKTPKCLKRCHKQAKCIRGKCVCKSGYKGDGIRSCTNIKESIFQETGNFLQLQENGNAIIIHWQTNWQLNCMEKNRYVKDMDGSSPKAKIKDIQAVGLAGAVKKQKLQENGNAIIIHWQTNWQLNCMEKNRYVKDMDGSSPKAKIKDIQAVGLAGAVKKQKLQENGNAIIIHWQTNWQLNCMEKNRYVKDMDGSSPKAKIKDIQAVGLAGAVKKQKKREIFFSFKKNGNAIIIHWQTNWQLNCMEKKNRYVKDMDGSSPKAKIKDIQAVGLAGAVKKQKLQENGNAIIIHWQTNWQLNCMEKNRYVKDMDGSSPKAKIKDIQAVGLAGAVKKQKLQENGNAIIIHWQTNWQLNCMEKNRYVKDMDGSSPKAKIKDIQAVGLAGAVKKQKLQENGNAIIIHWQTNWQLNCMEKNRYVKDMDGSSPKAKIKDIQAVGLAVKPSKCMKKCHKKAKCRKGKCVCKAKYQGDGVKSCEKLKRKPPKCRNKCHKKAMCRKGKCVCQSKYQGDGVKSCKKAKKSAYFGCYQDHSKRILPKDVLTDKRMTVQKCRQFCGKKGFKYAGVENGNACFCGDVLRKDKKRKESDCKTPCSGNKQQICGGPWRISIYTAQTSKCRNKCHKKAKCRKGKCVCKGKYQGDGVKSCKKVKHCRKTAKGTEYKGRISLTQTGRTCQYWERQYPHKHRFSISFKKEHNYCRNPDNSGQPWCYTNDPTTRWEYCQIPMCAPEDPEDVDECRKSAKGTEYKGRISLTQTGRTCQYWERQYPHKHPFSISFKTEHNYCRNPDNSGQPWCYTNDPTTRWEYCQIPMCAPEDPEDVDECRKSAKGTEYKGRISLTQTGRTCQYWERQYPHKHPFSISFKTEHNYCRNPDNSGQPWCYTNDPTTRWEYCQIPMCAACSVREEIVECKATVRVSGSCFYKSKVGSSCVYAVQLSDSQAIIKTSTQEMVLTNGGNLAECAIFTFNDGTLKIEDDVCKCFEATVVNK
ncbi:Plasminogen,Hepatocyte growth factor [Mytilus edulis]|uniref:Plasminogen,Hepatocyte growth factor n=1 Tax=Mytilus edulis TaxID=6550 RepID=A0A8S3UF91_MYTED|nr:Plasminogen,Hepatocyte growth factor [Mytilus edulis]